MTTENVRLWAAGFRAWPVYATMLWGAAQVAQAQGILGNNLIVNGGAESGSAGTGILNQVASIPGWTRIGTPNNINVVPYNLTGYVKLTDPAPPTAERGFQYFVGAGWPNAVTLTQDIDISSGASTISAGNVRYTVSAYLGTSTATDYYGTAQLDVSFKNSAGQTSASATLGPIDYVGDGMSLQRQIGLVPASTVRITVTLSLKGVNQGYAAADNLSLVLDKLSTGSQLGSNLIGNSGAEAGPSIQPSLTSSLAVAPYVPDWSTTGGVSVAPYGGTRWIAATDPGPADRGVSLFCGGRQNSTSYQDIDVSPDAMAIDSGQVKYSVSAWLGSIAGNSSPTLTYVFFDWSGKQLAVTAQLGPPSHTGSGMVDLYHTDILPAGTRRVRISLTFPGAYALADNVGFILASPGGPPVIAPGSVLSAGAFGGFTSISPGSWIEIYGSNLANTTKGWSDSDFVSGVAPTSLGGSTVTVGGKAAFIDYVSPGQINALVPSDAPTGPMTVAVTNGYGKSDAFGIYVNQTQPGLLAPPSFQIGGKQYLAALFPDGSFAIPANAIPGVASRPAKPGDTLIVYGVGFGAVTGGFTAGTLVTQSNSLATPVQFQFNNTQATPAYSGLAPSFTGLYQFNIVVPNVPANTALPVSFTLGGAKGTQALYIAVQN